MLAFALLGGEAGLRAVKHGIGGLGPAGTGGRRSAADSELGVFTLRDGAAQDPRST